MNKKKQIIYSFIFITIGIFFISIGNILNISNKERKNVVKEVIMMTINRENNKDYRPPIAITSFPSKVIEESEPVTIAHIKIPTYNQAATGYILGCEGVSLFMALKGLGYIPNYSIHDFMKTMPKGKTPFDGYMGNPKIGHNGENQGKRTTIYPEPLANWASKYATGKDLTGATIDELKRELDEGHVILVYVTSGWNKPIWKKYSWSINPKGEVENNHCLTIVGYRSNGDILVNDCHDGRVDGRQGEYWVKADKFAEIYNLRNYAVSVY